jgi:prophage regulatory protein
MASVQTTLPKLIDCTGVTKLTSMSRSLLYDEIKHGRFPRPVRLSANRVAWLESEVAAWLVARIAERDGRDE